MANYELKKPFEYAYKGDTQEASFIELVEPSFSVMQHYAVLKQAFVKAITSVTSTDAPASEPSGEEAELSPSDVMGLLYSTDASMDKVFAAAKELLCAGALVDGETKLTKPLIDKMGAADVEGLVGCYIANFIAQPLLDGQ